MKYRDRTFSDMSVAESCIDTHERQRTLMKRQCCIGFLTQHEVQVILQDIYMKYSNINTQNILEISEYLYHKMNTKFTDILHLKTIIIELLSEGIDNTNHNSNYTDVYRPILKDIIPYFINHIHNYKIQGIKKRRFSLFKKR